MIECTCGGNVEFTVVKDMATKVILLEACCDSCGRMEHGFGMTVEQALDEVQRKWNRRNRNDKKVKPSVSKVRKKKRRKKK